MHISHVAQMYIRTYAIMWMTRSGIDQALDSVVGNWESIIS